MPLSEDKGGNDGGNNRVSNMPLLFADGYPTSLNKITEAQLETFIPFMVQCSFGYVKIHSLDEFKEPEWWPKDLEFTKPFKRPKSFTGNWLHMMRQIVVECYSFHDCLYLLRYCNDLAAYEPTTLRFINNYNSTTSLYERSSSKLLVTFRNENMLYDQEKKINSRKCLLPKQSNSQYNQISQEDMVVSDGFDIYLCDNCDAELYSYGALVEHERVCVPEQNNLEAAEDSSDDDDVIFCGEVFDQQLPFGSTGRARTEQQKKHFLAQNFTLACVNTSDTADGVDASPTKAKNMCADSENQQANEFSPGKHRRMPRRARYVITLARCPTIPLSSPLGLSLIKSTKATCSPEYATERLERMDRFCHAPPLPPGTGHLLRMYRTGQEPQTMLDRRLPKWLYAKPRTGGVPVSFKRSNHEPMERYHDYKFPRRQFTSRHRERNYLFYNKPLIQRCRPCGVRLKRLTPYELQFLIEWPGFERRKREAEQAIEQERQLRKEAAARAMIIDSIDLCSSDDEEMADECLLVDGMLEQKTLPLDVSDEPDTSLEQEDIVVQQDTVAYAHVIDPHQHAAGSSDMDLETIVLEGDDADVVPRSSIVSQNRKIATASNGYLRASDVSLPSLPKLAPSSNPKLLTERTLRLNQSLPMATAGIGPSVVGPVYVYTNCTHTTASIARQTPGATMADSNRLLKENRINRWIQNGINLVDDERNPTPSTVMAQTHTMLLATPNVRTLFPVTFTNRSVAAAAAAGVGGGGGEQSSLVQTLTATTCVNQTVQKRRLSISRPGGPTATVVNGPATAANRQ